MQMIHEPEGPTYDELLQDNARLRGRLSERRDYAGWMVALNVAMLAGNLFLFGKMLELLSLLWT